RLVVTGLRQPGQGPSRRRLRDLVRPLQLDRGGRRPVREPGDHPRLHRLNRDLYRTAPALRALRSRKASRPARHPALRPGSGRSFVPEDATATRAAGDASALTGLLHDVDGQPHVATAATRVADDLDHADAPPGCPDLVVLLE